jgi:tetratricopeptide (TPR) repeat protein
LTRGTWLLLLVAIAMLAALVGVWHGGRSQNAYTLVESARARMRDHDAVATPAEASPDAYPNAMRELDLAVQMAEAGGDAVAARAALEYRAELLEARGARGQAALDYERLLQAYASGDLDLLGKLARCRLALGDRADALELCERILALEPGNAEAAALRGQALFQEGLTWLESAQRLLDEELSRDDSARGFALAERIAALDPKDPLRPALLHDLHALFPVARAAAAEKVGELIGQVSEHWVQARTAFAGSFERSVRPDAVYGLIDILYRSGRWIEAVDFGLVARNLPEAFDPQVLQILALSMNALGRPKVASKLVGESPDADQGLPFQFRVRLLKILYDAKLWSQMRVVGWHLHDFEPLPEIGEQAKAFGDFYQGLAEVRDNAVVQGHALLERYLGGRALEPFPGAVAVAWAALADAERTFQRPLAERSAIEASISLEPELSGDIWLRLAELQQEAQDPASNIERSLAQALTLLPERAATLVSRWRESGAKALIEQQRDTQLVWEELRRDSRWYPERESSAYERLALARHALDVGEAAGAFEAADSVLSDYADFLPALELAIEAQLALHRHGRAAELMLRWLARAPNDHTVLRHLRRIPIAELKQNQVLELMRADPRYSGILALGRYQVERGGGERVLNGIQFLGFDELGDEGRLLAARSLINVRRDAEALPLLAQIAATSPLQSQALRLRLEVASRAQDRAAMDAALAEVREQQRLDPEELLPAARALYAEGRLEDALALSAILDETPSTRGADALSMRAQLELLLGRPAAARESFERLSALTDGGAAELGLLILDIDARAWTDLPPRIAELEQTRASDSALSQCCRLALAERLDEARAQVLERIDPASDAPPAAPEWTLLAGAIARLQLAPLPEAAVAGADAGLGTGLAAYFSTDCLPEPRDLLALLLAGEQPGFESFAAFRARQMANSACGPLAALVSGRAALRAGDTRAAGTALREAAQLAPRLASAWDGLEQIEREGDPNPENARLSALRTARRIAFGGGGIDDPEEVLQRARDVIDLGGAQAALPMLTDLAERHKDVPALRLEIARARATLGDWAGALDAWSLYAVHAAPISLERHADEWIQLVERAEALGKIGPARAKAELEALGVRLPDHPLVALARAAAELRAVPQAPAIGIGRAFSLLDAWREQHVAQPINALREGAARRWFDFYLEVDPRRAEEFAAHELELDPGDLEPWLMVGEALRAQGRLQDALVQFDAARTMIPDGRILRHIADIIADLGSDHQRVEQMIERARKLEGDQSTESTLAFLRARSLVNTGPATLSEGVVMLLELWMRRTEFSDQLSEGEIGLQLGVALLHRMGRNDAFRAAAVLDKIEASIQDPMTRDLVLALAAIARRQDEAEREEPAKPVVQRTDG